MIKGLSFFQLFKNPKPGFMYTQLIRRQFLDYFKRNAHTVLPSSSVVPHDDPTLLFNNAGMNQFKDVFLGQTTRDYSRAATSQKCIRVGGKHNDLENVGHTTRHLTFFEMLGNFSFGDYFKEQAIKQAWEVSTEVFGFDPKRIWPTVYKDDDEAFELWTKYVPAERITRFGEKENFWMMGDTGPCGPCSELLYDRGEKYGKALRPSEDASGERFLEFWNLVFMQYNRLPNGQMEKLPKPSVDTGAGLERVVDLKMGVATVFETDVLRSLIGEIEHITKISYDPKSEKAAAFRVIADHLRCLAFAIGDGAQPSNTDRGYVLRKVLRRAVRYGKQLGIERPFLGDLLPQLIETMGDDYPELEKSKGRIQEILTVEEEAFIRTLKRGGNILTQVIEKSRGEGKGTISGDDAFKLKDTYGLPIEEILLIAKDSSLVVDEKRYSTLEEEAKERSRSAKKNVQQLAEESLFTNFLNENGPSLFKGYDNTTSESVIQGIVTEDSFVDSITEGQKAQIFLSETPFYAEMGGQVGDTGYLFSSDATFEVEETFSPYKGLIAHKGTVTRGSFKVRLPVKAQIDEERRMKVANNHTATHLLHFALHQVLGQHVKQAGSVVDSERLRFDFNHHKPLTTTEIRQIEDLINQKIRENRAVGSYEIPYEEAVKKEEIKQFFGEKYGNIVRVIDIDYSKELCGGTHTSHVGNIGLFLIAKESSIAAGVRRIEAVTGQEAIALQRDKEDRLIAIGQKLKTPLHLIEERVDSVLEESRQQAQELKKLKDKELDSFIESALQRQTKSGSFSFIVEEIPASSSQLKDALDKLSSHLKEGIIVLGSRSEDKCQLIAKVSDELVKKGISANELLKIGFTLVEGSGGGKPQLAQGAGKHPEKLKEALQAIYESLKKMP